ncbi:MAG TPA: cyclic nucleotide-binding domain-containing protein [Myxococcota bacterium]|nr:cyclic nucleotide-binding domain-containing protein [Myxococcota bacterium]
MSESPLVARLRAQPIFEDVEVDVLDASRPFWSLRTLQDGDVLWEEGGDGFELALLLDGEVVVTALGVELARPAAGELLGEVSAFLRGASRSASVSSVGETQLLTLRRAGLLALRRQTSPLYDALLAAALDTLAHRVRAADALLAQRQCTELPEVSPSRPPSGEPPDLVGHLRVLPGLNNLDGPSLEAIASSFRPFPVGGATTLLSQDDEDSGRVWILAEGSARVTRRTGSGEVLLARLGPGDPFGLNGFVEGLPRTATCVTETPAWAFATTRDALEALPERAQRAFAETLLAVLATQLRVANALLSDSPRTEFRALLEAGGMFQTLPEGEALSPASSDDALADPPLHLLRHRK